MSLVNVKWKLFNIANYILLISFSILLGLFLWFALQRELTKSDLPTFIPIVTGTFFIILNSFFNIVIFYKFFPDKDLSKKIKILYRIQTMLFIIGILALCLLILIGFQEEVINGNLTPDGMWILGLLFLLLIACLYVLVKQIRLIRFIKRNYKAQISSFIENIGID